MAEAQAGDGARACNPEAALVRLGDNRELYREVLERFFADSDASIARITTAIQRQNADELHRAAHSFKGLAAMSGTEAVARTAAELEQLGKHGQFAEAPSLVARLEREMQSARVELSSHFE